MMKRQVKYFLFYDGYRDVRVLDPRLDLRSVDPLEAWEDDPIHPAPVVYSKIAAGAAKINDRMRASEADMKRRCDSLGEAGWIVTWEPALKSAPWQQGYGP
jgi:hypothetical protein